MNCNERRQSQTFSLLVATTILVACASGALAQGPTLTTITVDGNPSDWGAVLANPLQRTDDLEFTNPCVGTPPPDKDCGNTNNITGRDLKTFGWTFDSTNIYLYLNRYGSTSNTNTFLFYMDLDGDQNMDATDRIFTVEHSGSNGRTIGTIWNYVPYVPARPAGDPMTCHAADTGQGYTPCTTRSVPIGSADGFTVEGSVANPVEIYNIYAGFADGTGFEAYLPWSSIGQSNPVAIYFHVGAAQVASPTQTPSNLDDNLGGPSGGIGAFGFNLINISPNRSSSVAPANPTIINYIHTVRNVGTSADRGEFLGASSQGLRLDLYDNGTNALMATDLTGDGTWDFIQNGSPDYDFDNDNAPDTPSLAAGFTGTCISLPASCFDVRLQITAATGLDDILDVTTLTTRSVANPLATSTVTDTTAIGSLSIQPSPQAKSVVSGQTLDYSLTITNYSLADVFDLATVSSPSAGSPWRIEIWQGATLIAVDANGDGDYLDAGDSITPGYDTNANNQPDFGTIANGGSQSITIRLTSAGAVGTVDTTTVMVQGAVLGDATSATLVTTVRDRITLSATQTVYSGELQAAFFPQTVINAWSASDTVELSWTWTSAPPTWQVRYFTDPNGDGNPADGALFATDLNGDGDCSDAGESILAGWNADADGRPDFALAANGGTLLFVLEVAIPDVFAPAPPVQPAVTETVQLTATGGSSAQIVDTLVVSNIIAFEDSIHTLATRNYARCDTVYMVGDSLDANTSFRFEYVGPGGGAPVRTAIVTSNGSGQAYDQYTFPAAAALGTWTVNLYANPGTTLIASMPLTVEPPSGNPAVVDPVSTAQASYAVSGDNLTITARFINTAVGADLDATTYRYIVTNSPGNTQYLQASGTFAAWTGTESTRLTGPHTVLAATSPTETITINNVTFPAAGVYRVRVEWLASCAWTIDTTDLLIPVGSALASYGDGAHTVPQEYFGPAATVFLNGVNHLPSTSYFIAYYNPSGNRVLVQTVSSDASGVLPTSVTAVALGGTIGTWTAVVYRAALTPPILLNPSDPNATSLDTFILDRDSDGDGVVNFFDIDDDNDGILDTVEGSGAVDTDGDGVPDSLDLDTDNDGINDLVESGLNASELAALDLNGDGRIDAANPVGANGLANAIEVGSETGSVDYNNDLAGPDAVVNTDGTGPADFRDLDSDNDGINDVIEGGETDTNQDGLIDGTPNVTTGQVPGSDNVVPDTNGDGQPDYVDLDSDGDGTPDITESGQGYLDVDADGDIDDTTDTDGDGIPDVADANDGVFGEAGQDSDNDGILDSIDIDDDNDGILDTIEQLGGVDVDTDGDGVFDRLDLDTDNDGINDIVESGLNGSELALVDANGDGRVDASVPVGTNGLANLLETAPDSGNPDYDNNGTGPDAVANSDGTGPGDWRDLDSDNDGIDDVIEGGEFDADGDGMIDGTPNPVTGQVPGSDNITPNVDGTGLADYRDLDSDDDGMLDIDESGQGYLDADDDGDIDDTTDTDGDGLPNVSDGIDGTFGDRRDSDNDGIPDVTDIDDDNDGILDTIEGSGAVDTDGDGVPDSLDLDTDNDGINDIVESGLNFTELAVLDANGDGRIDHTVAVGTNGLANLIEAGGADSGSPDYDNNGSGPDPVANTDGAGPGDWRDLDSDNDGIDDVIEGGETDDNGDGRIDGVPHPVTGQVPGADDTVPDSDGTGGPDYRDLDSDGDGTPDIVETGMGILDGDSDGDIDDTTDPDGDGIPSSSDGNPAVWGDAQTIPNLLRNDAVTDLAVYSADPTTIFTRVYPLGPGIPAMQHIGANVRADEGEGALTGAPGSSDDDDFYISTVLSPMVDPDSTALGDASRPLIFYELTCDTCSIRVNRIGGQIQISW